ncbi:MAG: thiamine pyrophosphate-dependent enzyme, partial [Pseudomonadota bacterium]
MDQLEITHQNFIQKLSENNLVPLGPSHEKYLQTGIENVITNTQMQSIFKAQIISRTLDRVARQMQHKGCGYYTIASSGHESMASIANAARTDDMAFLHYRDAAFLIARAMMSHNQNPIEDLLASFAASTNDPISGGRHKVLGSADLLIPPQTSTIASHLPKAVGAAYAIQMAKQLKISERKLKKDAIIICSFGDASLNHASAQSAINSSLWASFQGFPMPLLLICEDNGLGISTPTPQNWVESSMANRHGLHYISCNGLDFIDSFIQAQYALNYARQKRKPVFLHFKCVRLGGHAGSDVQKVYLSDLVLKQQELNDPLLISASIMLNYGVLDRDQMLKLYLQTCDHIEQIAKNAPHWPRLKTAKQVMQSIIPKAKSVQKPKKITSQKRKQIFDSDYGLMKKPQHMARLMSWALSDLMLMHDEIILAGEDIAQKGGVYHVTAKAYQRFGPKRVINTLLDEQSILGFAIGVAHNGLIPICEIQFLAYLHNAEDQLRGEAASLSFFSKGQFTNPMIIRIAGLGYQKGFGGHFHNDNSIAVLRDIPGIIIACPSNGYDSVLMLRESVKLARENQRIIVFIEPIALYMTRDLHHEKDHLWAHYYPSFNQRDKIRLGEISIHGDSDQLTIISYANGYYLTMKAQKILKEKYNIQARIIDLRWLKPINEKALLTATQTSPNILIVDECRAHGNIGETLVTLFANQ